MCNRCSSVRPAVTNAELRTLAKFGVRIDEHGRVRVSVRPGRECVVESGDAHRLFVAPAQDGRTTLLSAHGQVDRTTRVVPGSNASNPPRIALASIVTE